jgi:ribonuclease HII
MTSKYEKEKFGQGYKWVIGCDEVGRGCLAGPVVAAGVILDFGLNISDLIKQGVKDSKLLTAKKREELSEVIKQNCVAYGIGAVEPDVIDKINIHHATLLAMRKAVESLLDRHCEEPDGEVILSEKKIAVPPKVARNDKLFLYLDGKFCIPKFNMEQEAVVAGDNKILSVAAASIVAKVYRDDLMRRLDKKYPCYNFAQHKGYGTLHHRKMIFKHGLSVIHRVSFCKNLIAI